MSELGKLISRPDIEQRFVGLIESLEKQRRRISYLTSFVYCSSCNSFVNADLGGGIADKDGVKLLFYNCQECYSPILIRRK